MDTLAHGLWGGVVFGGRKEVGWGWAFVLGMAPDLLSFGPFFVSRLGMLASRWASRSWEPPDPAIIPAYVYHAYNVTHSLLIWAAVAGMLWLFWRRRSGGVWPVLLPFGAWALHILCDIPTHSTQFFPTPYLWPLDTPFVNGRSWGRTSFMIGNYTCLLIAYVVRRFFR